MDPEVNRDHGAGEEQRRADAAGAGHLGDEVRARAYLEDPSPAVRAAAFGALVRIGVVSTDDIERALTDEAPTVRRTLCELAGKFPATDFAPLLADRDAAVVEAACFAVGEQERHEALDAVIAVATSHSDALCREAAVAALGALGDDAGRSVVIAALSGAPPIRRRAVIALAAFEGEDVSAALVAHREDRDWQVRQAVEDVLGPSDAPESTPSAPPPGPEDSARHP